LDENVVLRIPFRHRGDEHPRLAKKARALSKLATGITNKRDKGSLTAKECGAADRAFFVVVFWAFMAFMALYWTVLLLKAGRD